MRSNCGAMLPLRGGRNMMAHDLRQPDFPSCLLNADITATAEINPPRLPMLNSCLRSVDGAILGDGYATASPFLRSIQASPDAVVQKQKPP